MGDRWGIRPVLLRDGGLVVACALLLLSCATVPQAEHQLALDRIDELEEGLSVVEDELATVQRIRTETQRELEEQQLTAQQARNDLEIALRQLGTLREERQDLLERVATLEQAIESGGAQSIASILLQDEAAAAQARATDSQSALAAALAGRGGFLMTDELGLRNQPRVADRYAAAAPGIAADLEFGVPRLFDARLDYEETAVFLTISDPAGQRPRLTLHAQYGTNEVPLYVRSVFISIEGRDPVDPIDPIVISGEPFRRTDGEMLLESITIVVDAALADRLITMISSSRFTVTFVGIGRQHTHRPTVSERAALSNILFAWMDLSGRVR